MHFIIYGEVLSATTTTDYEVLDTQTNLKHSIHCNNTSLLEVGVSYFFLGHQASNGALIARITDPKEFVCPLFEEDIIRSGSSPFNHKPDILQKLILNATDNRIRRVSELITDNEGRDSESP